MNSRGGMRERLKRVVLKTTVRETVPGVRIPLPPPDSLYCRELSPLISLKFAKYGHFSRFLPYKPDCRERTSQAAGGISPAFSLKRRRAVRFARSHEAKAWRSQTERFANPDLTFRVSGSLRLAQLAAAQVSKLLRAHRHSERSRTERVVVRTETGAETESLHQKSRRYTLQAFVDFRNGVGSVFVSSLQLDFHSKRQRMTDSSLDNVTHYICKIL